MNQDELWNEIVAKIATHNILSVAPSDVTGIQDWKKEVVEKLKKEYTISRQQPSPIQEGEGKGMKWVKASERLPEHYKKVAAKRNGWYGQLTVDVYNVYFLKDTFDKKFPEMFSNIEWLDETSSRQWTDEEITSLADSYAKAQGSHDKPEITAHDFTQGFKSALQMQKKESEG